MCVIEGYDKERNNYTDITKNKKRLWIIEEKLK